MCIVFLLIRLILMMAIAQHTTIKLRGFTMFTRLCTISLKVSREHNMDNCKHLSTLFKDNNCVIYLLIICNLFIYFFKFLILRCPTHIPGSSSYAPPSSLEHGGALHDGIAELLHKKCEKCLHIVNTC